MMTNTTKNYFVERLSDAIFRQEKFATMYAETRTDGHLQECMRAMQDVNSILQLVADEIGERTYDPNDVLGIDWLAIRQKGEKAGVDELVNYYIC